MRPIVARVLAIAVLGFGAGCSGPAIYDPVWRGPFFTPTNYVGEAQLPPHLRRVIVLPIHGGEVASVESVAALDPVFIAELQRQNRFEVVTLSREECQRRFRAPAFSSAAALPHDFIATLKRDFAVDAVLFMDVTVFRAYRPLAIGVRAKLATVDEVRLLWTFDTVFSLDDPAVANSARRHYLGSPIQELPGDPTVVALQSPLRFGAYVAAATFETLPLR